MKRRLIAAGCTLAVSSAIALGATAGGSGSYAPSQRNAASPPGASATELRVQLARERHRHHVQVRLLSSAVRVVRHQYGTDKLVQSAITLASITYGVDRGWMSAIIRRESRFRPWAINPSSGACGLAQFVSGTWMATPQGKAGLDCRDPLANAMAMAWLASQPGGRHNWDL